MKAAALFVCTSAQLYDAVGANRERLIPAHLRKRWESISFSVVPLSLGSEATEVECIDAVENAAEGFAGVIVLAPEQIADRFGRCREARFVVEYGHIGPPRNIQNQAAGLLQRALTNFGHLVYRSRDLKYLRSLLLPLHDFRAPPIDGLRALFTVETGQGQFARTLDAILRDLRSYQVPIRVAKDEVHPVYVDDDDKCFDRGRERHAEAEISIPPHHLLCGLNKAYRFGFEYDKHWHFNVTTGGDVRCHQFNSCHPPRGAQSPRASHANIFPNGYVT